MRISIDATALGGAKTGTAVYLTEILRAWNRRPDIDHEFVLFASPKAYGHLSALGLDRRFRFLAAPDSRALRMGWQQTALPWQLMRQEVDVHWGCGFVLPLLTTRPTVVTIHDLTFQLFPAHHELVKRYYFPSMMAAAVRKAKRVIAISETTRLDLHRILPRSTGKTEVTLLAPRTLPASGRVSPREQITIGDCDGYIICLGTQEPRKNLCRLLDAWLATPAEARRGIKIAVVGAPGWMLERTRTPAHDEDGSIVFLGFVDDEALDALMRGALFLAYPSLYEGFGLPVVEAMHMGLPVLTSDVGATREVAGDCAVLVDPTDVGSIRDGLRRLLEDRALRERLGALGRARAARFSWSETARLTLDILERAASTGA